MLCSGKPVNIDAKTKPHVTQNIVGNHQIIRKLGMQIFKLVKGGSLGTVNKIFHVTNYGFYELRQKTLYKILPYKHCFQR